MNSFPIGFRSTSNVIYKISSIKSLRIDRTFSDDDKVFGITVAKHEPRQSLSDSINVRNSRLKVA